MIVVLHSVNAFRIMDNAKIVWPLGQGVSFFFVLSGFILTFVYPSLSQGRNIRNFYVARVARIWPAHFMAFLLVLFLIPSEGWVLEGKHQWQIGFINLFLLHGWIPVPTSYFSFNWVSWSISTEAFFYLAFPFLICRLDCSWRWKLLCTAAFVVATLCLTTFLRLPPFNAANLSVVTAHGLAYISPFARILEFVFGMAVATLCLRWRTLRIVSSSPAWLWTMCEVLAISFALTSICCVPQLVGTLFDERRYYAFEVYGKSCGSFLAFGLLIGVLSFERGMLSRILSLRLLVLLGEISYSVYLVHQIIVRWYEAHKGMFTSVPKTMLYIAYWLTVLILSFLIWRVVERPCQQWIRALFRSKRGLVLQNEGARPHSLSG